MRRPISLLPALALALLGSGCASDPARFYTLTSVSSPAAAPSKLSVVVGPVSVPASVDRPQIVVTTGANQVVFDDFNRWASPLQDSVPRVVADDLAALLGTAKVVVSTQAGDAADAGYRVRIEIRTFDSAPGKSAALTAVWTVRRLRDGRSETGRTSVSEALQDGSYDAVAAAHSRSLARLSQDIADAIRALERTPPA